MTPSMTFRSVCRLAVLCGVLFVFVVLPAGCTLRPREHLQGRWYNATTSIRFREDGSVIYNSVSTGLTTGRYHFDGQLRPESANRPVNNLTLDLVVNGRTERWPLEVQFLGDERLRLRPLRTRRRGGRSGAGDVIILTKAPRDGTASLAAAR